MKIVITQQIREVLNAALITGELNAEDIPELKELLKKNRDMSDDLTILMMKVMGYNQNGVPVFK